MKFDKFINERYYVEEHELDILSPEDIEMNSTEIEKERETIVRPTTRPTTRPSRPSRPSKPSPIRRDKPSIDIKPKATKKASIDDLVKKAIELDNER